MKLKGSRNFMKSLFAASARENNSLWISRNGWHIVSNAEASIVWFAFQVLVKRSGRVRDQRLHSVNV